MTQSSRLIILLDLNWTRDKDPRIPLGHASLLAALRDRVGISVLPIVRAVNQVQIDPDALAAEIVAFASGHRQEYVDVAIGAYVWGEDVIQRLLPCLRKRGFLGRIILGGPQVSYSGPGLETIYPDADVFVRGYGEDALVELSRSPQKARITGVHYAGEPDRCEQAKVVLENLRSPWIEGDPLPTRFLRWETQRGCPFRCAFCQHQEAGSRLARRELAGDRVNREIELFCRHGVEDIAVLDPIFNAGPRTVEILQQFVDHNFQGKLSLQCRAEFVTPEFIEVAKQLDVCLEFGLQTIHPNEGRAVRRQNDIAKVDQVLSSVRAGGINHEISLIFGLPEQTIKTFLDSVGWCLVRKVPVIKAFPLMLLRGTQLQRERIRWGLRESKGAMPVVTGSDTFTEIQWATMERVSEALRLSEGLHPSSLEGLLGIADSCQPEAARWSPISAGEAS